VFYGVGEKTVEILAIVAKAHANEWLETYIPHSEDGAGGSFDAGLAFTDSTSLARR
jgi:hypothetical protein